MHTRERTKSTATGPLALAMLTGSELRLHGDRDERIDLNDLFEEDRRVLLLYPAEGASVLDDAFLARDPRPVTLIVPDGNWRQAARASKRMPGIERAEAVVLGDGKPTAWGVRFEPKEGGLATFEAIARAYGVLESPGVQAALERVFESVVRETFAARGEPTEAHEEAPARGEPPVEFLYEDASFVFVNKLSGDLVHRGWADDDRPLMQRVRDQLGMRVYPVHRLDRGTSGVLLFAKSPEDARLAQVEFEAGRVEKRYLALCRGCDPGLGRVDHPLATEDGGEKKPAITDFRLLGASGRYGWVEAFPRTGRVHQIRRHLKHLSHPIIGDVRYGKGEHNRIFRDLYGFHRLALHAERLSITHPRTGERLDVHAGIPADLRAVLDALGL